MKKLPKGWKLYSFSEICKPKEGLKRGPFGSAIKKEYFVPFGYKVYEQRNAIYDDAKKGNYYISSEKYNELIKFNVEPGDFIVSCSGTLGKIAQIPNGAEKGVINQALLRIRVEENILSKKYFLYFFRSSDFQRKILFQSQGTAMTNMVGMKDFKEIQIPLPPLETQQRIVTKIEELFSELDKGVEELKKTQEQLKTYRQSVLKWAFEGRFTNENVKDGELPEGWEWKKICEISKVVRGGSPRPAGDPKFYDGNIPFLKVADLTRDNGIYLTTYNYTIKEAGLHKTRQISPNTLLLTNSGATLGVPKICMIHATMNDGVAAFLDLDERSNHYMYYFWLSKTLELRGINMGAGQPNLNTDLIKEYKVPYCTFEEQHQIVQEIESRLSVADKLEEQIKTSLQQAEALRQSILNKAFEGELVR